MWLDGLSPSGEPNVEGYRMPELQGLDQNESHQQRMKRRVNQATTDIGEVVKQLLEEQRQAMPSGEPSGQ